MLVPKKEEAIPANELFQSQPLDQGALFNTPISEDTLFTESVNEGEGLSRVQSGFNSFAKRLGKALFEELPKTASLIGTQLNINTATLPPELKRIAAETDLGFRIGEYLGESVDEMFPENEEFQDEMLARVIPAALGDVTATAIAALATRGAGTVASALSAAAVGSSTISSQEYEQAIESGGTAEEAFQAFLFNLPVGSTEAIPIGRLFRRLDNFTNGGVREILGKSFTGGLEELIQESVQTSLTNVVASETYDETRKMFDGIAEAAKAGGVVGFLLNAVGLSTKRLISGAVDINDAQEAHNVNEELQDEGQSFVEDYIRDEYEAQRDQPIQPPLQPAEVDLVFQDSPFRDAAISATGDLRRGSKESPIDRLIWDGVIDYIQGDQKPLDNLVGLKGLAFNRLRSVFEPAREALRSQFGETIPLYRVQRVKAKLGGDINLLSFTSSLKTAKKFAGRVAETKVFRVNIPIDDIIWSSPESIEREFIVDVGDQLRQGLNNSEFPEISLQGEVVADDSSSDGPPPPTDSGPRLLNSPHDPDPGNFQTFDVNPDDELGTFQRFFQRWLSPRGLMTEETFEAIKQGDALRRAEVFESEQHVKGLYGAVREHMPQVEFNRGRPSFTAQQEQTINSILRGSEDGLSHAGSGLVRIDQAGATSVLPQPVVEQVLLMRRHIDRMSTTLLEDGLIGGPLGERVAANIGSYIHRSYRAITDGPRWARSVPIEVRNRAESFIRQRYLDTEGRIPTPREVNNIIESLLYNQDAQNSLLLDTQFGGVDLTILRTRTAVPAPIRALLGEVEAPIANYLNTAERLSRLVSDQQTLGRVAELGMGQVFFEEGNFFRPAGYNQVIDSLGDPALNPLHGMVTHPDILKSLKEVYGKTAPLGRLHKAYLKLNGLAKLSKTVLSPITHARNTLGGSIFLVANGHNPLRIREPKRVLKNLREGGANTRKRRYIELDLMDQSIAGSELDAVYREMRLEDGIPMMENFEFFRPDGPMADLYNRTLGRGIEASIKLYQAEDNLIRLTMFEKELRRYRQALDPNGQWGAQEVRALEEQVAGMVRNTYPNYARVPESIRRLRRNVLVGPFVSFPYEVIRTTMNTARLARGETRSSNQAIRAIGVRRALGLMSAVGTPIAVGLASAALNGISAETEDDIERMAPHWDQNTPKYYVSKENGKVRYINLGYITPYSVLTDPVQAALFGHEDSVYGRFLEGLSKFGRSFLGVELTTQALDEIRNNEKSNGSWVTNPANPLGTKFADYFAHLWDAFEPGLISSTITKPLEKGPDFKPAEEGLAMLTGFRITELDVGRSLTFKAREFNRNRRNARSIASSVIRDDGSSLEDRVRAASVANEVYEGQWREMQRLYESSLRLGMTQQEVDAVLDGAGIGKKIRQDLALRAFTPLEIEIAPETP